MKITWKRVSQQYGPPVEYGYVGKWKIFEINWHSGSKTDERKPETDYDLSCSLPGIKAYLGQFSTESAKVKAASVWELWHDGLSAEKST